MTKPPIQKIGFIGLGIMGASMARNLIKSGYEVTVYNRTASKCKPLRDAGAQGVESPAAMAAQKPDVICINVTNTQDVSAILLGDDVAPHDTPRDAHAQDAIITTAQPGLIIVDHSTISPVASARFAEKLATRNVIFLDAPVSGGDVGAQNATLSIMVGGDESAFNRCQPMFESVGKSIMHMGISGCGQACKSCNQIAGSMALLGVCEALALAKKSGLDPHKIIQVISGGASGSWPLANLGPKIADDDMAPGFFVDYMIKDLGIALDTAETHDLDLPGTMLVRHLFQQTSDTGHGRQGTQALCRAVGANTID